MQITFRPGQAGAAQEIRDLTGGSPHALWTPGETREIADDHATMVREADGTQVRKRTIDALFLAGPVFVDAATGKNPLFVSARSGEHTTDEGFFHSTVHETRFVRYEDERGGKLTMVEFLSDHPEFVARHASMPGIDAALIAAAKSSGKITSSSASTLVPAETVSAAPPAEESNHADYDAAHAPEDHE